MLEAITVHEVNHCIKLTLALSLFSICSLVFWILTLFSSSLDAPMAFMAAVIPMVGGSLLQYHYVHIMSHWLLCTKHYALKIIITSTVITTPIVTLDKLLKMVRLFSFVICDIAQLLHQIIFSFKNVNY